MAHSLVGGRGVGGRLTRAALAVLVGGGLLAGCGSGGGTPAGGSSGAGAAKPSVATSAATVHGTVTVFAAASLTGAFRQLATAFQTANPGAKVVFQFGGSDTLARQIVSGAPADVFAAANQVTMDQVVKARQAAGTPSPFARNQLEIVTPPGNPRHVASLADLAKPGVKVALCAAKVPCGSAAAAALRAARVTLTPATYTQDVTGALTTVELGEADAALVYQTDVRGAGGKVTGVQFPESGSAVNVYPITALAAAPNPAGARAFLEYVRSSAGQAVLRAAGFQPA